MYASISKVILHAHEAQNSFVSTSKHAAPEQSHSRGMHDEQEMGLTAPILPRGAQREQFIRGNHKLHYVTSMQPSSHV